MSTYIKRSGYDRRQSVNDLEYFARGGDERRSHGVERRAYERVPDFPERGQELPVYGNQQGIGIVNQSVKYGIAVFILVTAYLVWKLFSG